VISHGIDKNLSFDRRLSFDVGPQGNASGHVAARAITADGKERWIGSDAPGGANGPEGRRKAILRTRWERPFRRQTVVYRNDDAFGASADLATHVIMRVEAADHEAAAMEEQG
jgi:hypothetical protein